MQLPFIINGPFAVQLAVQFFKVELHFEATFAAARLFRLGYASCLTPGPSCFKNLHIKTRLIQILIKLVIG